MLPPRRVLLDEPALLQQELDIGAFGFLQDDPEQSLFGKGQFCPADGFLIDGVVAGAQKFTHVVLTAPDLRHAAVDVQQRVDGFHAGTHGVFRGEDGVARGFGELTDEREVHGTRRHDLRAVGLLPRLEEGVDIRHEAGRGVAGVVRQGVDSVGRHADVIQPFAADLFAGAIAHGFLHIVALAVGIQRIEPDQHHVLILRFELRLAVDRPGEIPVVRAVLDGDDTTGRDLTGAGVTLADVHNIPDDFLVRGRDGGAHPVGCVNVAAEFFRVAVLAVLCLCGDGFPHIPRLAETVPNAGEVGRMGLIAVAGSVGAAAVRDEHEVVLHKVDGLFCPVLDVDNLLCDPSVPIGLDDDVLHVHAVFNPHAMGFEVFD